MVKEISIINSRPYKIIKIIRILPKVNTSIYKVYYILEGNLLPRKRRKLYDIKILISELLLNFWVLTNIG
jgi:hypothetical protein